jgi:membrane protein YdbS with pleckstrin-like domain
MMAEAEVYRGAQALVAKGEFSPKLRIYMLAYWTLTLVCSVIGIVLLPIWLVIGPIWIRQYHATLRCDLTERNVVIGKGLLFRKELTIPLDKIQDISIREGPLLTAFGLLQLRIETAGQSNTGTGKSDADLMGLIDARALRDRILAARDGLTASVPLPADASPDRQLAIEIRDTLLRIEAAIKDQPLQGTGTPPPAM